VEALAARHRLPADYVRATLADRWDTEPVTVAEGEEA
jgi:hypothetical protein